MGGEVFIVRNHALPLSVAYNGYMPAILLNSVTTEDADEWYCAGYVSSLSDVATCRNKDTFVSIGDLYPFLFVVHIVGLNSSVDMAYCLTTCEETTLPIPSNANVAEDLTLRCKLVPDEVNDEFCLWIKCNKVLDIEFEGVFCLLEQ